ncbi:hypothetical protein AAE478_008732 [Parahypoxylon ruwenzoriense]
MKLPLAPLFTASACASMLVQPIATFSNTTTTTTTTLITSTSTLTTTTTSSSTTSTSTPPIRNPWVSCGAGLDNPCKDLCFCSSGQVQCHADPTSRCVQMCDCKEE